MTEFDILERNFIAGIITEEEYDEALDALMAQLNTE